MKFTLSWLKEHLDTTATVDEIAETLTDLGLEVEEVVNPADKLAPFTLGKVVKAEQHPDADRLRVCMVATDEGEKQIICGAPNAREGITVVVCKPGDYVPGIDTTLSVGKNPRRRKPRHDGVRTRAGTLRRTRRHHRAAVGRGRARNSPTGWRRTIPTRIDPMIEIAITPNRQDALGRRGHRPRSGRAWAWAP